MDETESGQGNNRLVVGNTFDNAARLLEAFSQTSAIGFAVLDNQLRYQAINNCLANINGMPAESHLGFTVREIFGKLSEKMAEPRYQRVLAHGEVTHFEVKNAILPARAGSRFWALNSNFPIRDRAGRVRQIGILVVDVTEQRKLEKVFRKLAGESHHAKTRAIFSHAQELHDAVDQYHTALATRLDGLSQCTKDPERIAELLTQSIASLDQRIVVMRRLVSAFAERFQVER
jgi:PAS domain S-box-containing protein